MSIDLEQLRREQEKVHRNIINQRAAKVLNMESNDTNQILFTLLSMLYDVNQLRGIVGKRIDTDYLLYTLAKNDEVCMDNLCQCIDVNSLLGQLSTIKEEYDIFQAREKAFTQLKSKTKKKST